ncbi:GL26935 [Drosophila persimilis]|uniref:GL26935 n=1 Tax=Drosophila persimilis TaxID=7234 RepID=B4HC79_DROPE|nr:GL26935 [Drosophila persimilis]
MLEDVSVATNARGRALLEITVPLDIALLNQGNQHTFFRAGIGSAIGLTFVSSSLFNSAGWIFSSLYTWSEQVNYLAHRPTDG